MLMSKLCVMGKYPETTAHVRVNKLQQEVRLFLISPFSLIHERNANTPLPHNLLDGH
jgi:hypothetical protein